MEEKDIICLESLAFQILIDKLFIYIKEKYNVREEKWITGAEAKRKLNISSDTTLQQYRNEGKIRFSQPAKKIILYDKDSINEFLNKHAKETF